MKSLGNILSILQLHVTLIVNSSDNDLKYISYPELPKLGEGSILFWQIQNPSLFLWHNETMWEAQTPYFIITMVTLSNGKDQWTIKHSEQPQLKFYTDWTCHTLFFLILSCFNLQYLHNPSLSKGRIYMVQMYIGTHVARVLHFGHL